MVPGLHARWGRGWVGAAEIGAPRLCPRLALALTFAPYLCPLPLPLPLLAFTLALELLDFETTCLYPSLPAGTLPDRTCTFTLVPNQLLFGGVSACAVLKYDNWRYAICWNTDNAQSEADHNTGN
jgi:hypothetical protein